MKRVRTWALLAALALAPVASFGQTLADKMPKDTIAYVGWAGAKAVGPAYEQSHFKGLLDAMDFQKQFADAIQHNVAKETDAAKKEGAALFRELGEAVFNAPSAIYFGGLDLTNPQKPMPKLALVSMMGNQQATALAAKLNPMIEKNKKPDAPEAKAYVVGNYMILSVGPAADFTAPLTNGLKAGESLAEQPAFKAAFAGAGVKDGQSPAAAMYMDGEALIKAIDDVVTAGPDAAARRNWPLAVELMGLDGLKQIAWSGNFDGKNWASEGFIGMKGTRTGLLGFFDAKPMSEGALKLVPANASWAGALRFDGGRLLEDLRNFVATQDENTQRLFDFMMQRAEMTLGLDIKKDLFDVIGDEFVYYGNADAAGNSLKGFTMVAKLKDAKKADAALNTIEQLLNATESTRNPESKRIWKTTTVGEGDNAITFHSQTLPEAQPTWAIHDGHWFFALSEAGVKSAIAQRQKADSLADTPAFKDLKKRLGDPIMTSFSFSDMPKMAPEAYQLISAGMTKAKAERPDDFHMTLPPLDALKPHLAPALDVYWVDKDGWHGKGVGPFAMSNILSGESMLITVLGQNMPGGRPAARPARRANNNPPAPAQGGAGGLP